MKERNILLGEISRELGMKRMETLVYSIAQMGDEEFNKYHGDVMSGKES